MAEKKYQVFISSTFSDLKEERRKILDVLLMADCIPAGMEAFVASDTEQFEVILYLHKRNPRRSWSDVRRRRAIQNQHR